MKISRDTIRKIFEAKGVPLRTMSGPEPRAVAGLAPLPKAKAKKRPIPVPIEKPSTWTWFDYARQCDLEFATPHWLRKAPVIKAWLERNGVMPG